eukprot:CAMPEP_0173375472 /NCGR_PEP_ID=MMETSP1144-20121109/29645_1 /TAXON_ID=483371 /ORGANISM="non described non described, Strain CCMP2298" /LENGTH=38 /DNA_ID= /DNA_START= /DNA_END= /DNA_ORIENTATION=
MAAADARFSRTAACMALSAAAAASIDGYWCMEGREGDC